MTYLTWLSQRFTGPTLVLGVRGNMTFELTVYGARDELRSGDHGNWVPNPALRLAQLLASM